MKEKTILFFKGALIGIAGIMPGVSGGVLAVTLGIYEKVIYYTSNFFKDIKKSILFLMPIIIGGGVAILLSSVVLSKALDKYNVQTTLLFLGLLLGGMPSLLKKVNKKSVKFSNLMVFVITFTIAMAFVLISGQEQMVSFINVSFIDYVKLFLVGIIAAVTLVVPGISGSLILMIMGYYRPILDKISSLLKFNEIGSNLLILVPFGLGVVLGILLISKLINFLLKKYSTQTYYGIYGVILASIIGIIISLGNPSLSSILVGLILMIVGSLLVLRLGKEE